MTIFIHMTKARRIRDQWNQNSKAKKRATKNLELSIMRSNCAVVDVIIEQTTATIYIYIDV